jgi:hypothetical protein
VSAVTLIADLARPSRRRRGQRGQAIILVAVMITFLLAGAVGMAVDAVLGYVYSVLAERAAASGALAGVVFMPNQFSSPPNNNATDRAIAEARQNGFDVNDIPNQVRVVAAQVPIAGSSPTAYYANKLQVTVSRQVPVYFMRLLGFSSYQVSRTAIATYLPPITLGQPGGQIGSTASQLGSSGNYYFMRTEGWNVDRGQGDPFSPSPAYMNGGSLSPAVNDVHQISTTNGTEPADATLPSRGGYNYLVTIPSAGGRLQIYNAAFAPDGGPNGSTGPHNFCDNFQGWTPCSPGGSYYLHEQDSIGNFSQNSSFSAMRYTLFQVNNTFIRSNDVKLTQTTVYPIDATNWNASPPTYRKINGGGTVTQTYDGLGNPTDMAIYHNWIDVASYSGSADSGLVALNQYGVPSNYLNGAFLVGGTYRLRVDNLDFDGSISASGSGNLSHKAYAVRVLDTAGSLCTTCGLSAWNDMCLYTPISGGSFTIPIFQLPPYYAGKTITIDIFDVGDLSGSGDLYIDVIDPVTGGIATSAQGVIITDLGIQRGQPYRETPGAPGAAPGTVVSPPGNTQATFQATSSSDPNVTADNRWFHIELPIPNSWNPGSNPNNWWWSVRYRTSLPPGTVAIDTFAIAVGLKGNPAHLLQG